MPGASSLTRRRNESAALGASLVLPISTCPIPEMGLSGLGFPLTEANFPAVKSAHAWLNSRASPRNAVDLLVVLVNLFPLFVDAGGPSRIAPMLMRAIIGGFAVVGGISRERMIRLASGGEGVKLFLTTQVCKDGRLLIRLDEHSRYDTEEVARSGTSAAAWCALDLLESPGHCLAMARRNGAYFSVQEGRDRAGANVSGPR